MPRRAASAGMLGVAAALAGCLMAISASHGAARYRDLRAIEPIRDSGQPGSAQRGAQKAAVCISCHGADGVSVAPIFPRLAGQRIDYLYQRLLSFRYSDPKDPYYSASPMTSIAAQLSDADMRDLAAFFAGQTPQAPGAPATVDGRADAHAPDAADASQSEVERGGVGEGGVGEDGVGRAGVGLFLHGDPARGVPPCQGCHGADAAGPSSTIGEYAAYPSLRGQYAGYVVARLYNFRSGRPSDTSNAFIMHGVAANLADDQIQAIAAWLGSLPPTTRGAEGSPPASAHTRR